MTGGGETVLVGLPRPVREEGKRLVLRVDVGSMRRKGWEGVRGVVRELMDREWMLGLGRVEGLVIGLIVRGEEKREEGERVIMEEVPGVYRGVFKMEIEE